MAATAIHRAFVFGPVFASRFLNLLAVDCHYTLLGGCPSFKVVEAADRSRPPERYSWNRTLGLMNLTWSRLLGASAIANEWTASRFIRRNAVILTADRINTQ